jgi:hypothetical protein
MKEMQFVFCVVRNKFFKCNVCEFRNKIFNSNCSNRGRNKNFALKIFPIRRVVTPRSVYIATRLHHTTLTENFVFR